MFPSAIETIMERNLIRTGLVTVTLGTEAWLLLMGAGFAFAGADSGRGEFGLAANGVLVLMLVLPFGGLACVVGSRDSLRVATVVGVVLLALGLGLIVMGYTAFQNDVNSGAFVVGFVLPAAVVLGGTWLMRQTADPGEQHLSEPRPPMSYFGRIIGAPVVLLVVGYLIGGLVPGVAAAGVVAIVYILVAARR